MVPGQFLIDTNSMIQKEFFNSGSGHETSTGINRDGLENLASHLQGLQLQTTLKPQLP